MTDLTTKSVVAQGDGFVLGEVDGEVVALSIDRGTCYGLNRIGSRIWKLIVEPRSIDEVCARLVADYDVDLATCERDVIGLLEKLRAEGMVVLREAANGA